MQTIVGLLQAFDEDGDARSQIAEYTRRIEGHVPKLKSFYTGRGTKRDATDSDESDVRARARPREDGYTELEAHGYQVEPDCIETEHGTFESLRKVGAHTV